MGLDPLGADNFSPCALEQFFHRPARLPPTDPTTLGRTSKQIHTAPYNMEFCPGHCPHHKMSILDFDLNARAVNITALGRKIELG